MSKKRDRQIHAQLDGEVASAACTSDEVAMMARYRDALRRLESVRVKAPPGLAADIMAALPRRRRLLLRAWLEEFLPQRRQWAVPAFAGALLMLVTIVGVRYLTLRTHEQCVLVHFQIHAPGAQRVELVGDFNNWTPGVIRLQGPDASGHWTTDIELPEGRYEYQFLVNGKTWVTDPNAPIHRPDGFGRENAVMDVYEERG